MARKIGRIVIVGDMTEDNGVVYKVCTKCKKSKPLVRFGFRRMFQDDEELAIQPQCRECRSE